MNENGMLRCRLLKDSITDPFRHFAVEEALTRGIDEGFTFPTLRLRQTEPSVWIGVYQYPEEDVDIDYCTKRNIKIVRRPNPGGAVYQDQGSFCFSLFFPKKTLFHRLGIGEAADLYPLIGNAVINTCAHFGVPAELSPVNDITIKGRKVYGSAQVEFYSAIVHSGTFLVKTNIEEMERCLRPSQLKFSDKGFYTVSDRVVNLCTAAEQELQVSDVMEELVFHLSRILGIKCTPGNLIVEELGLIDQLYRTKYSDPAWTFRKKDIYETVISTKSRSGVISVGISWEGETISDLNVKGDFLIPDQGELNRTINELKQKNMDSAVSVINSSNLSEELKKALTGLISQSRL